MADVMLVPAQGAALRVEREGAGLPVLVPTGGGIPFYRNTLSGRLKERLALVYVAMRGTGGSSGSIAGATFASLADDLEAVRLALGLGRVAVLGHSNHGAIALEYGLRHPDSCAGVLSIASMPDFRESFAIGDARFRREAGPERLADFERRQASLASMDAARMTPDQLALESYLALAPLGWRDLALDARALWGPAPEGLAAYFEWMREQTATWSAVDRLGELRVPLLAVCGGRDYLCPREAWKGAIGAVPQGRLLLIEDGAHNPQFEDRAIFDAAVLDFLA